MPRNADFPEYEGLKTEHAGDWDPTKYKNYVDPGSLERGRKGRELPERIGKRPVKIKPSKATLDRADIERTTINIDPEIARLARLSPSELQRNLDR